MEINELDSCPFEQFLSWFHSATAADQVEPEAMTLATATPDGKPSARIVLFKGIVEQQLLFFTNYDSRKGQELINNPHVSLVFYWSSIRKQIRVEGQVKRAASSLSEDYFHSRPRESQLSAWASSQSKVIASRKDLMKVYDALQEKYHDKPIPLPPNWGGFMVTPQRFEFWSFGDHRLHDRFLYEKQSQEWIRTRLSP